MPARMPVGVAAVLAATSIGLLLAVPAGPAASAAGPVSCRDVTRAAGLAKRPGPFSGGGLEPAIEEQRASMGAGAAVGDVDADGDLDLYLLGQDARGSRLYRNDSAPGRIRFRDVTRGAGLERRAVDRVSQLADLDGDQDVDLVVAADRDEGRTWQGSAIYRNRGDGSFEVVQPELSGFDPVGVIVGGMALADVDADGFLDIYVSYWTMELGRPRGTGEIQGVLPGENRLYRNLGDLRFEDVSREVGLSGIARDSYTPILADLDGDADADLYLAVDHRPDVLRWNEGGWYRDGSAAAGASHVGNDMGVAVADVDGDGLPELFSTNITDSTGRHGTRPGGNTLLAAVRSADGLTLEDRAQAAGVRDTGWGWGAAFTDLDLDGRQDLVAAAGVPPGDARPSWRARSGTVAFRSRGDGTFRRLARTGCDVRGDARALVAFDADRDGDEDLLVTHLHASPRLLEVRARGTSLTVSLGPGSAGVGAWVWVTADGRRTGRVVLAGGSYLAGPPAEAVFGLDGAGHADAVDIRWSDGSETHLVDVPAGLLRLAGPGGPAS